METWFKALLIAVATAVLGIGVPTAASTLNSNTQTVQPQVVDSTAPSPTDSPTDPAPVQSTFVPLPPPTMIMTPAPCQYQAYNHC